MNIAVVIPVGPGREENLEMVLEHLLAQVEKPCAVVLVGDGVDVAPALRRGYFATRFRVGAGIRLHTFNARKHEPGMEQPRNVGVHILGQVCEEATHVWFCDSDVITEPTAIAEYKEAFAALSHPQRPQIAVGPYEWLPEGVRRLAPEVKNDPRWWSFENRTVSGELSDGLACFSGNLVWEIDAFKRIGGFWNEIHHARCEDGELGLRAIAHGLRVLFVPRARGYHLWHPVDLAAAVTKNTRDVPMLNARHPWVQEHGVFVAERDGRRFEQRCAECGAIVNTIDWWEHQRSCAYGSFGAS